MEVYYVGTMPIMPSIAHHGIKGMKWGVRRYQNPDGSYTAAGRARYGIGEARTAYKQATRAYKTETAAWRKATLGGLRQNKEATRKLALAKLQQEYAKEDLRTAKTKAAYSRSKVKTKRQAALEKEYRAKGMSQKEAELAAFKRDRVEKALMVAGGVAITAAALYAAKNYRDIHVDQFIKPGTKLSRIASSGDTSVKDGFYAVFNRDLSDRSKYAGLYGTQKRMQLGGDVYRKVITLPKGVKLASEKSAIDGLKELASKDTDFKDALQKELRRFALMAPTPKYDKLIDNARKALARGDINRDVYRAFNMVIADKGQTGATSWPEQSKKYMEYMRKKGYGAIRDVNDMKYSGYRAHNPLIVFSAADAKVESVKKMSGARIAANAIPQYFKAVMKQPANAVGLGASGAVVAATKQATRKRNDKIVQEYRQEHPNTKLSYQEIVRNWERTRIENG